MKDQVIALFRDYPNAAFFISTALSVLVALAGVLPSVFITAANILFFGFWKGTLVSLLGEVLGALVSFWMYRKGFKRGAQSALEKYPKAARLVEAEGRTAMTLIFSLRLLPFMPSGLVTLAAAIGKVSTLHFMIASSAGKIPALLLEAFSVYGVTQLDWPWKTGLALFALVILVLVLKKKRI